MRFKEHAFVALWLTMLDGWINLMLCAAVPLTYALKTAWDVFRLRQLTQAEGLVVGSEADLALLRSVVKLSAKRSRFLQFLLTYAGFAYVLVVGLGGLRGNLFILAAMILVATVIPEAYFNRRLTKWVEGLRLSQPKDELAFVVAKDICLLPWAVRNEIPLEIRKRALAYRQHREPGSLSGSTGTGDGQLTPTP